MRAIMIILIILGFMTFKPTSFDKVESIKREEFNVEVKGHLKNPGLFEIKPYSNLEDLMDKLELYEDSDLSHYSLTSILKQNDIIVVRENEEQKIISINSASKESLMTLKGIGEKVADRIIDYRTNEGPFYKLEDLMNVKGIGEKIFQNIKDYITL